MTRRLFPILRWAVRWLGSSCGAFVLLTPLGAQEPKSVPIVYSSDLFHPPDDPDDTVDLVTLFSLPELDIRGIVLDLGQQQNKGPGEVTVRQMMALTGRSVPFASGLLNPLRYPEDTGEDQFGEAHGGRDLLLSTLRQSTEKVVIVTVGSLRDVAAAFNQEPDLFREKLARLYVNAGNSGGGSLHWNTRLDPMAYIRIMTSDLPVYWAPSFDGKQSFLEFAYGEWRGGVHESHWKFQHSTMFDALPASVQNYFLYALAPKHPTIDDPTAYLNRRPQERELKERVWREYRHMWSTLTLYEAAGRQMYRRADEWRALAGPQEGWSLAPLWEFAPTSVSIDPDLTAELRPPGPDPTLYVLRQTDPDNYRRAMLTSLRQVLQELPLDQEFREDSSDR